MHCLLNMPFSLVLDTACSSSLYCLHVACTALANNECDGAIVAAANLIQSPEQQMGIMKVGVLSPTSTCHVFDASADGYGRAEAANALYVKRLSDAVRNNDPIHAVIRSTAVNSYVSHSKRPLSRKLISEETETRLELRRPASRVKKQ